MKKSIIFPHFLLIGALALMLALLAVRPAAAQMTDPRVAQLEEQVRQLNGLVEELNFQILQMQDQLRRMQEDNELRFQEIEERRSDNGSGGSGARASDHPAAPAHEGTPPAASQAAASVEGEHMRGEPPRNLGSITFDADGSPRIAAPAEPSRHSDAAPSRLDDATVAALPPRGNNDDEVYSNAYEFILSGDYDTAEAGFRDLIERFPNSKHAADAHFWLGEAVLAQEKPREAAEIFLAASRDFPQARKAPDTLFKLGVSLAAIQQRDVACATFAEVLQRYPQASDALKERVKQEQAASSC